MENRGENTNNVSLICRYTDDGGWYEFNIFSSGLYKILVFDAVHNEYRLLAEGGSKDIRIGKKANQYGAQCMGEVVDAVCERQQTQNSEGQYAQ